MSYETKENLQEGLLGVLMLLMLLAGAAVGVLAALTSLEVVLPLGSMSHMSEGMKALIGSGCGALVILGAICICCLGGFVLGLIDELSWHCRSSHYAR